jgi:hypothetical protein
MTVASLGSQGTQVEGSDVYVMQFMLNSITANGTIHTYIHTYIHTVSRHHAVSMRVSGFDILTETTVYL